MLLADVSLLVALYVGNWAAYAFGADVQAMKWPMVFYGGLLMMLLIPISLVWVVLKWITFFSRTSAR